MAVTKHNLGNLNYFVRGATEASNNSYTVTDADLGITLEFLCINTIPMSIIFPSGTSLDGVDGTTITLNQGEYLKIQSRTPTQWYTVFQFKRGVAVPDGSSIDTLLASLRTAGIIAT